MCRIAREDGFGSPAGGACSLRPALKGNVMAKGQMRSNKEARKPKATKPKKSAALSILKKDERR